MFNFTVCLFLKKSLYIRELTFKLEEKFKIEMYKVEKLKSFLDCEQCKKLLVDPVLMACGKFICKLHLDKMLTHESKEENTFICEICQENILFQRMVLWFLIDYKICWILNSINLHQVLCSRNAGKK